MTESSIAAFTSEPDTGNLSLPPLLPGAGVGIPPLPATFSNERSKNYLTSGPGHGDA